MTKGPLSFLWKNARADQVDALCRKLLTSKLEKCGQQALDANSNLRFCTFLKTTVQVMPELISTSGGTFVRWIRTENPLRQPDPGEGWVYAGKELGPVAIIVISDAACDPLNAPRIVSAPFMS